MQKFKFFAIALATVCMMFSCKPKEKTPVVPDQPAGPTVELPTVAAPEVGMTKIVIMVPENTTANGAYAVGTINEWAAGDIQTARFHKVAGEERWYELTVAYSADLQLKVCAVPSDSTLAGWSYQWAKNIDPSDPNCTETEDHVIILQGDGELVFENGGQPKLTKVADKGIIFINVKAWAADPNIKDGPCADAWAKHPWNGGDWTYRHMTKMNDNTFSIACRYGNNGFNIADNEAGTGEQWYPVEMLNLSDDDITTGDSVLVTFTSEKGCVGSVDVVLIEKGEYTPVPGGNATFYITMVGYTEAEGDKLIFTGNFDEQAWQESDRYMTYVPGKEWWTWGGDYPEDFEFKVIVVDADGNMHWCGDAAGANIKFDGENYEYVVIY